MVLHSLRPSGKTNRIDYQERILQIITIQIVYGHY
jgi:hypothetical protein